ncbi:MAG: type II toxin-antitoxin system RelE/ParE family toxin [Clostridia bacterium]|nr:type II toxin-antitoxin system RelE/ParE family toxin [Clostridia bacterium]
MRAAKQEYRVTVTTQARDDLRRIYRFVADEMMLRQTAAQQQRRLRRELEMLRFSPARHQAVPVEPWQSRGVRSLFVGPYAALYLVDEDKEQVSVLRVMYCGI